MSSLDARPELRDWVPEGWQTGTDDTNVDLHGRPDGDGRVIMVADCRTIDGEYPDDGCYADTRCRADQ